MTDQQKQGGWFVYVRNHGRISYHKYCIEGDAMQPDSRLYYEQREIQKFPLTEKEYQMPLEQLHKKYPRTKQ